MSGARAHGARTAGQGGQIAVEYSVLLVCVALVLFVSVDGVSLLSVLLDALRHLNFSYLEGLGACALPI